MVDMVFTVIFLVALVLITVVSLFLSRYKHELWEIWIERVSKRGRK